MNSIERRQCDTLRVRNIWTSIEHIKQQKQVANSERLSKLCLREYGTPEEEVEKDLVKAVHDGLVAKSQSVAHKGSKPGTEQVAYRIPKDGPEKDDHDWYCFKCHKPGSVLLCSQCQRVYHPGCLQEKPKASNASQFKCPVCINIAEGPKLFKIKNGKLNHLLGFTCKLLTERAVEIEKLSTGRLKEEEMWMYDLLVFRHQDFASICKKVHEKVYTCTEEFMADILQIQHNNCVFFGPESLPGALSAVMVNECQYEIDEMKLCRDCYLTSNVKMDNWFSQPCRPPHKLVFAKQTGFPFWPAKVMRELENDVNIRFFGCSHERALLSKTAIMPFDTPASVLKTKKTPTFKKAWEEVEQLQEAMEKVKDDPRFTNPNFESDIEEERSVSTPAPKRRGRPPRPKVEKMEEDEQSQKKENEGDNKKQKKENEPENKKQKKEKNKLIEQDARTDRNRIVLEREARKRKRQTQTPVNEESVVSSTTNQEAEAPSPSKRLKKEIPEDSGTGKERPPHHTSYPDSTTKETKSCPKCGFHVPLPPRRSPDNASKTGVPSPKTQEKDEKLRLLREEVTRLQKALGERDRRIGNLENLHKQEISETKKKQWCYYCESEAIYHCCWNTAYCSTHCQQLHWQAEHRKLCKRKR
ncbi:unnamed protein product [Darwinula stevensoni]|uniref:Zinc finger MYND domain-containing protein 11 n=1 Tax=Darwinula stevensoni TaxID=69355 RepID=A0A7R9A3N6_9CRUS|nr:unnamed protein product [Darwinula stevensoni]CAG0888318.1 unnamed protein product [Darwinula stevensoni]